MKSKKAGSKGELRSRWKAMLEDGSLSGLRSEGRLMALYVLYTADWSTCEVRFSMRKVAVRLAVQPTTVRRGVSQLVDAGILRVLGKSGDGVTRRFEVQGRARAVRTPDTSGAHPRAPLVRTPDTSGAHPAHEPCAARARVVRSARTRCAHDSVLASGIPVNTSGDTSAAPPTSGRGPDAAGRPKNEEVGQ